MPDLSNETQEKPLDRRGTETLVALLSTNTKTEAAERLKIDFSTLHRRIIKYKLNTYLDKLPEQALESLKLGGVEAAVNFRNKIKSRNEAISMDASREILDRIGVTNKQVPQTNIQNNVVIIPNQLIDKYGASSSTSTNSQ